MWRGTGRIPSLNVERNNQNSEITCGGEQADIEFTCGGEQADIEFTCIGEQADIEFTCGVEQAEFRAYMWKRTSRIPRFYLTGSKQNSGYSM